jgi:hypothetical protein
MKRLYFLRWKACDFWPHAIFCSYKVSRCLHNKPRRVRYISKTLHGLWTVKHSLHKQQLQVHTTLQRNFTSDFICVGLQGSVKVQGSGCLSQNLIWVSVSYNKHMKCHNNPIIRSSLTTKINRHNSNNVTATARAISKVLELASVQWAAVKQKETATVTLSYGAGNNVVVT